MIAWSIFAVGGVYVWASAPLVAAALVLSAAFQFHVAASAETRPLDRALIACLVAIGLQLVPLPQAVRTFLSFKADDTRSALSLVPDSLPGWHPLSIEPASTAYALALVTSAVLVFWTCRQACGRRGTRPIVRAVAIIGLIAAMAAVVQQASDPRLIYGRWMPQDEGARPFGPFVNRNHFATWVLMAVPLAAGYVAATVSAHRPAPRAAAELASLLRGFGSSTAWVAIAAGTMTLGLVASTSRSGLVALGVSVVAATWLGRSRLDRRARVWGVAGALGLAAFLAAYGNLQPLLARVEETLAVGAGGRPRIWQETLGIVGDFWLTGTGLGSYQTTMLVYQQVDRAVFVNQAHNQYLQLLAEGGLLLVLPAAIAAVAFLQVFRARLARDRSPFGWFRVGAMTALLAVAVQSCWETGLRMPANGLLFAVAAAIAIHRPAEKEQGVSRRASGRGFAGRADV